MVCSARRPWREELYIREQEAAAVEEDEEMEREDEQGVAKWPVLNELDEPGWAELALDTIEWRKLLQRIAL
jgi:hypothetical protein